MFCNIMKVLNCNNYHIRVIYVWFSYLPKFLGETVNWLISAQLKLKTRNLNTAISYEELFNPN